MLHIKHYCKFCGHALNDAKECKNKNCPEYVPDPATETVTASTTTTADSTSTTAK